MIGKTLRYGGHDLHNQRGLVATNGACHDFVITNLALL